MSRQATIAAALLLTFAAAQAADVKPAAHSNFDHPAVAVARLAQTQAVNANTFLVQPPAAVTWTVQPESKLLAGADLLAAK